MRWIRSIKDRFTFVLKTQPQSNRLVTKSVLSNTQNKVSYNTRGAQYTPFEGDLLLRHRDSRDICISRSEDYVGKQRVCTLFLVLLDFCVKV